jgi:hypothetical protein
MGDHCARLGFVGGSRSAAHMTVLVPFMPPLTSTGTHIGRVRAFRLDVSHAREPTADSATGRRVAGIASSAA